MPWKLIWIQEGDSPIPLQKPTLRCMAKAIRTQLQCRCTRVVGGLQGRLLLPTTNTEQFKEQLRLHDHVPEATLLTPCMTHPGNHAVQAVRQSLKKGSITYTVVSRISAGLWISAGLE